MQNNSDKKLVGSSAMIKFPEMELINVPARIDTGARSSSIWGHAREKDGRLAVVFFGKKSALYTGKEFFFKGSEYEQVVVSSSTGHVQVRYKIKLLVLIKGKKVRAAFTIADRSMQVYPVLVGRNVLRGKFLVDVKKGQSLHEEELRRSEQLRSYKDESKSEIKKELDS